MQGGAHFFILCAHKNNADILLKKVKNGEYYVDNSGLK